MIDILVIAVCAVMCGSDSWTNLTHSVNPKAVGVVYFALAKVLSIIHSKA